MKLPLRAANGRYTATLPPLCGGIHRHGGITGVADNGLWESENLWWKDGALRTRPGWDVTNRYGTVLGKTVTVCPATDDNERPVALVHTDGRLRLIAYTADATVASVISLTDTVTDTQAFCVPAGGKWAQFYTLLVFADKRVWGVDLKENRVTELTGAIYVPLRLTAATPNVGVDEEFRSGTVYEGANRLTPWFRAEFRADGAGTHYRLPCGNIVGEVTVEWVNGYDGYWIQIPNGQDIAQTADGWEVSVNRKSGWICFDKDGEHTALAAADTCNIRVLAATDTDQRDDVFSANAVCWFGGTRSGAAGGTRLFLGNGSRLLWSALEDPLYFPVENEAQVGMGSQTITALHRQADRLVIFKERELYTAEYEALSKGTTLTETAAFPLTPLHGEIGCDLPATVALRGNRLVWACRDGVVYTLSAFGSLTQPGVSRLSTAVEPLLQEVPDLVSAAMNDGRYWLLWGERMLVLEEGSDPVWHVFTVPQTGATVLGLLRAGNRLLMPTLCPRGEQVSLFWFTPRGEQDCRLAWEEDAFVLIYRPIPAVLCTKAYDMGQGDTYKQVLSVTAGITAADAVAVTYLTERGEEVDLPARPAADGLLRLTPAIARCRRFAIRLAGENLCLDSMTIRLRGGMR